MLIRPETPADAAALYDLVKTAFETAAVSNGDEQNYMERLRAGPTYRPDLALVAEEDGRLIGQIMLTTLDFTADPGTPSPALLLGPIAVTLLRRGHGVASRLIERALDRATEQGFAFVLLVGDPAFYGRFGFVSIAGSRLRHADDIPEAYILARRLDGGDVRVLAGTVKII